VRKPRDQNLLLNNILGNIKQQVFKVYGTPKVKQPEVIIPEKEPQGIKHKITDENLDALLSSKRSMIRKYEK